MRTRASAAPTSTRRFGMTYGRFRAPMPVSMAAGSRAAASKVDMIVG
jgi:hypothetical protein